MYSFNEIAALFEQFLQKEQLFLGNPKQLYQPCQYLLDAGGKRIRPILCLMGHELFATLNQDAYYAAMSLELFHNFTLMHDDIMDEAPLRRGRPTVHKKYGLTAGILSGDVMNIYAYQQLSQLSQPALLKILPLFNQMAIKVCEGQQLDFEFESKNKVTVDQYLKMIELKTSALLALSLQAGSITGGGTEIQTQAMHDFGIYLGMAFQLQDDYLDTFGLQELTGKQPGGDIIARKKTILHTHYHDVTNDNKRKKLDDLLNQNKPDLVAQVTALYKAEGVDKAVLQMVAKYSKMAFDKLNALALPEKKTQQIAKLCLQLLNRKS